MIIPSSSTKAQDKVSPTTFLRENKEESKTKVEITAQSVFSNNNNLSLETELIEWAKNKIERRYTLTRFFRDKPELTLNETCTEIPFGLTKLQELTSLTLEKAPLVIPPEFNKLQKLEALIIKNGSGLKDVPLVFCELTNLEWLQIDRSEISSIPFQIGHLTKLKFLRITDAKIQECSFDIFNKGLKKLVLNGNCFEKVPDCFVKLSQRCVIHLDKNHFNREYIKEWQSSSHSRIFLSEKDFETRFSGWAHNDQRRQVFTEIFDCYKYNKSHLRLGECDEIPLFIHQLTHISSLTIHSKGSLENLISQLGKFVNLTYLEIISPTLSSLPKEIGSLANLETLSLSCGNLVDLPKEIGSLANLKTLSLSCDNLADLPKEIGSLANLKTLSLSCDNLADLPKSLENLKNLASCFLEGPYDKFPLGVVRLSQLNCLGIRNSRITEIPEELCQLKELRLLDLSGNQISTIPSSFSNLINLVNINFANNLISDLPSGMDQLKNLKIQNLDGNRFKEIPASLFAMHRGVAVSLKDNLFEEKYLDEHGASFKTNHEKKVSIPNIILSNQDQDPDEKNG